LTVVRDGGVSCDGCQALVSFSEPGFHEWLRLPMQSGPEAHLCPQCQVRRDRGWLAEDYVLECYRCHRNSVANPEVPRWRVIPSMTDQPSHTVCIDCFDPATDQRFL
jgi:hypothetical protein